MQYWDTASIAQESATNPARVHLNQKTLEITMRKLLPVALTMLIATSAVAQDQKPEDVVEARRAYFTLVGFNMDQLAAMAKGEVEYNAETAKAAAANLQALTSMAPKALYAPGTSNADVAGKTRALPAIWSDFAGYQEKGKAFRQAVVALNEVAGNGRADLGKAVMTLGGTCKGCHSSYRAKGF